MAKPELSVRWGDGDAYERFMGRWSRAIGLGFLEWLGLPAGLDWLDVGCGTGAFTSVILDTCAPKTVVGIDSSGSQVATAVRRVTDGRVKFQVSDAQALSFEGRPFDVAVSGLVLNFVPDQGKMLAEMKRVTKPAGTVAAYVWDFAGGGEVGIHICDAIAERDPEARRRISSHRNDQRTTLGALANRFEESRLDAIETRAIEIDVSFPDFESYWDGNTTFTSAPASYINGLSAEDRRRFKDRVRALLPVAEDGSIAYTARAAAARGIVPA